MVPNGVGTGRSPAKSRPPRRVWQELQLPIAMRSRPRLTRVGSNVEGEGGSTAAIPGRHATAKTAAAPATTSAANKPPTSRPVVIGPDRFAVKLTTKSRSDAELLTCLLTADGQAPQSV